ncbi:unnamed protein product [Trypanosoma congolense IL3000]|uniref:WGS project CAEQ00000000 data, annotated contig 1854 n=1 Tax=Trypanosoma congolense (strain IL3000) TaxID=1068625 RepID=F9W9E5_TRYCI|nr:unnamed protein product [Trypanosoma congolense IL3000]
MAPSPVSVGGETLPVSGPAMELFVVLYNGAVSNCEAGFAAMTRAYGDGAQKSAATVVDTLSSVLVSTKAAFKSFTAAAELALLAEQALADGGDDLLTAADRHLLQKHFDFHSIREMAELCVATAKYAYSTASGAVAKRHDTLAKLAYAAATAASPLRLGPLSSLLPVISRLLMVAYHRHTAEHHYRQDKVPNMSVVLGHIVYAKKLMDKIREDCPDTLKTSVPPQNVSTPTSSETVQSVRRLLGRLSATVIGSGGEGETGAQQKKANQSDESLEDFVRRLEEGNVMKVLPIAGYLIHDVVKLYDKYQHENSVVHYVRPLPEEEVKQDIPETDLLDIAACRGGDGNIGQSGLMEELAKKLETDLSKFSELPAAKEVMSLMEDRELSSTVKHKLRDLEQLLTQLQDALCLPQSVESVLNQLEPILHTHVQAHSRQSTKRSDSPNEAPDTSCPLDTCLDASQKAVEDALLRHEQVSDQLYRTKCEYIGEYVAPFEATKSLQRQKQAWVTRADALRTALRRDFAYRGERVELRDTLLLPEGAELQTCLANARSVVERAKATLTSLPSAPTSDHVSPTASVSHSGRAAELRELVPQLSNARASSNSILKRVQPLQSEMRWIRITRVLREAVAVIHSANSFVQTSDKETSELERQQSKITAQPIKQLHSAVFKKCGPTTRARAPKRPPSSRRDTSLKREKVKAVHEISPEPTPHGEGQQSWCVEEADAKEASDWHWPSKCDADKEDPGRRRTGGGVEKSRASKRLQDEEEETVVATAGTTSAASMEGRVNLPEAVVSPLLKRRIKQLSSAK